MVFSPLVQDHRLAGAHGSVVTAVEDVRVLPRRGADRLDLAARTVEQPGEQHLTLGYSPLGAVKLAGLLRGHGLSPWVVLSYHLSLPPLARACQGLFSTFFFRRASTIRRAWDRLSSPVFPAHLARPPFEAPARDKTRAAACTSSFVGLLLILPPEVHVPPLVPQLDPRSAIGEVPHIVVYHHGRHLPGEVHVAPLLPQPDRRSALGEGPRPVVAFPPVFIFLGGFHFLSSMPRAPARTPKPPRSPSTAFQFFPRRRHDSCRPGLWRCPPPHGTPSASCSRGSSRSSRRPPQGRRSKPAPISIPPCHPPPTISIFTCTPGRFGNTSHRSSHPITVCHPSFFMNPPFTSPSRIIFRPPAAMLSGSRRLSFSSHLKRKKTREYPKTATPDAFAAASTTPSHSPFIKA